MKVGSLVERVSKNAYLMNSNGPMPENFKIVPYKTPVVICAWRFGLKSEETLFFFGVEGYHEIEDVNGVRAQVWYASTMFRELQPPMDLSFIEEMQMGEPVTK